MPFARGCPAHPWVRHCSVMAAPCAVSAWLPVEGAQADAWRVGEALQWGARRR